MAANKKDIKAVFDLCKTIAQQISDEDKQKGQVSEELKNALDREFSDIIEFTRFYLIQAYDKLYGTILMDIEMYTDFKQAGAFDLKIAREPFALTINPLWCTNMNIMEFIGGIVNELMKLLYMHMKDFSRLNNEKDPEKHDMLEKASSASSSSIVQHDIKLDRDATKPGLRLPKDVYTTSDMNNDYKISTKDEQGLDYYYKILQKFPNQKQSGSGDGQGMGSGGQGQGQGQGNGNGQGVSTPGNGQGNQTHDWEGTDEDEIKNSVTTLIANAWNSLDERSRGLVPAGVASQIKMMMEPPEIPWQRMLRQMIGSNPAGFQPTRRKLNRRQPYRADLPGRVISNTVRIVAIFDTSGSMSDDDLRNCGKEVLAILEQKKKEGWAFGLTVIECDATVNRVYDVKNANDFICKTSKGMAGRGGTCFTPAINFVNGTDEYSDKKKYPKAGTFHDAFMIYFTDGYGDYEIPKPNTYRNLWVVLDDVSHLSVKQPYGEVAKLKIKRYN